VPRRVEVGSVLGKEAEQWSEVRGQGSEVRAIAYVGWFQIQNPQSEIRNLKSEI
jgi:hypothetical protein